MALNHPNPSTFLSQENSRLMTENKDLSEEVQILRDFVRMLSELSTAADRFDNDEQLIPFLHTMMKMAIRLLNASDGSLAILDPATNELEFVVVTGTLEKELVGYRMPADEGIAGWVIKNRESTLVKDVRLDIRFSNTIDDAFKFRTQSLAAAPLIGNQRVFGVVEVLNTPSDEPFTENNVALLKLLCRTAGEALADMDAKRQEVDDIEVY